MTANAADRINKADASGAAELPASAVAPADARADVHPALFSAVDTDTDELPRYDESDYQPEPLGDGAPLLTLETAVDFLRRRCGVAVPTSTVRRLFSFELMGIAYDAGALADWARRQLGSCAYPTFDPVPETAPPRVLLLGPHAYDIVCLTGQLTAFGADVFSPCTDPSGSANWRSGPEVPVSPEALRIAATLGVDAAWLHVGDAGALAILTDALLERGVPCVVKPGRELVVPAEIARRVTMMPRFSMVTEIHGLIRENFPPGVVARLDLTRPMIEDWSDVEAMIAYATMPLGAGG